MANTFHLAVPAGDIPTALKFYKDILGCKTGNQEEGHWIDVDFWGNELTLHQTETRQNRERHHVDMGEVCVPHFGIHLTRDVFDSIKEKIETHDEFKYLDEPYLRFKDDEQEQETFFIKDPSGNVIEIKTMRTPELLWADNS